MDRPVIFLQFLLVLVVAINVLSACQCGKRNKIKHAVCMSQTLIMAYADSARYADISRQPVTNAEDSYFTIYSMILNVMYKKGHHPLGAASTFELLSATKNQDCGVKLELKTDYFISGTAINKTHLFIHSCDYVERVPWFVKTYEEIEKMNDLLTRQTQIDCKKFCRVVTDFDAIIAC